MSIHLTFEPTPEVAPEPSPEIAAAVAAVLGPDPAFVVRWPRPFCVVLEPRERSERDVLHEDLLAPVRREAFFALVGCVGLVVVLAVHAEASRYRDVRGRSSRGRLSQGEYFHHDGCSGPTKPRVVEIRCPFQSVERSVATAVAPFPETVYAMLRELPASLREAVELRPWREQLAAESELPPATFDLVQGLVTRAVRRGLSAVEARAYFREVDRSCGAYDEPWQLGESRFIANASFERTMQHRRAYASRPSSTPSGKLLKRWPAEEL